MCCRAHVVSDHDRKEAVIKNAAAEPENTVDLDGPSLAAALRDFEIANGRTIDLTKRLIAAERARLNAVDEVERLRIRATVAERELAELKSSKAYRLAQQLGELRSRFKG
jgi:hypothetical protein